jgi:hypothetical protein|tara:strand:+ start:17156 stop:17464 length:309 start_codon:yes stop_codon:yes gene_type:complete
MSKSRTPLKKSRVAMEVSIEEFSVYGKPEIIIIPTWWGGFKYPTYSIKQGSFVWSTSNMRRRTWSWLSTCLEALSQEENPLLVQMKEDLIYKLHEEGQNDYL